MADGVVRWVSVEMPVMICKVIKDGHELLNVELDPSKWSEGGKIKFMTKGQRVFTDPIGAAALTISKAQSRVDSVHSQLTGELPARFGKGAGGARRDAVLDAIIASLFGQARNAGLKALAIRYWRQEARTQGKGQSDTSKQVSDALDGI